MSILTMPLWAQIYPRPLLINSAAADQAASFKGLRLDLTAQPALVPQPAPVPQPTPAMQEPWSEFMMETAAPGSADAMDGKNYVDHLGFFCKKEFEWENATGVPLRLRLATGVRWCEVCFLCREVCFRKL